MKARLFNFLFFIHFFYHQVRLNALPGKKQ